ncbi:GNAT family N-acetyltransferase [Limosilactobacillus kribbianus]|uniref:GNAT family N-acetyltransferase n=1 Tax=Limosilactobacillus kribbianus TaxID=2982695 RepID=UPI0022653522|nr:GNAT family N-acetyltransferase [Limosilactobacillus kribbianus]
MWKIKHFDQLTTKELYAILQLRTSVFVVAQKRIYQEVDGRDLAAIHIFNETPDGQIVAYARVFLLDDGQTVSFGRVVTSKAVRGQGMGGQLLDQIMQTIKANYPDAPIFIESQEQVQDFYRRVGFESQGEPFIYKSTPHVKMIHAPLG